MAEVTERTVQVDGLDIFVRESGRRTLARPSLVLGHGMPSSSFLYRKMLPILGDRLHAVAFDWPGFGSSSKPRNHDYTFASFRDLFPRLLAALDVEQPIVGVHDFAGPVLLDYTTRNLDAVRALVVMNTTIYGEHWHPPAIAKALYFAGMIPGAKGLVGRLFFTRENVAKALKSIAGDPSVWTDEVLSGYWAPLSTPEGRRAVVTTWADFRRGLRQIRGIKKRVAALPHPALIVWGAADRLLPLPNAEAFAKALRGSETVMIPGAGHFLQEERPREVAEAILAWYDRTKL